MPSNQLASWSEKLIIALSSVRSSTRRGRQPAGGWRPAERLSFAQALKGFTRDAAWAGFAEGRYGSLEPGKWADFILVDRDVSTADPQALAAAVSRLLSDESLRLRLGKAASENALRRFRPEESAARLTRIYQELLERKTSKSSIARGNS